MASVIISMEEYQEYQLLKEERAGGKLDGSSYKKRVNAALLDFVNQVHTNRFFDDPPLFKLINAFDKSDMELSLVKMNTGENVVNLKEK